LFTTQRRLEGFNRIFDALVALRIIQLANFER